MYVCVTHRTGKHNLERWHTNTHTDTHTHTHTRERPQQSSRPTPTYTHTHTHTHPYTHTGRASRFGKDGTTNWIPPFRRAPGPRRSLSDVIIYLMYMYIYMYRMNRMYIYMHTHNQLYIRIPAGGRGDSRRTKNPRQQMGRNSQAGN